MKFTILGHASLLVEHHGASVLFDPWLVGSCYWRSWWNYPELSPDILDSLRPEWVYITHLHWDHFHGPTLRRFPPTTKMLVPKIHTRRMVDDLRFLGFTDVRELPHGGSIELGEQMRLHSYQFGIGSDSAVVIEAGAGRDRTVLYNANDCKLFGDPLRRVVQSFGRIDFVFRSYSSASAIPYCIEDYERKYPNLRRPEDYVEEFGQFAMHIGATWAVPFASNHCFLHKDTVRFNTTTVSPEDVARHLDARATALGKKTRAKVMPPGSSWTKEQGFDIRPFDYAARDRYIAALAAEKQPKLEASSREEERAIADWAAFVEYMKPFLDALPAYIPRIHKLRVTFEVKDAGGLRWFHLDYGTREIRELDRADEGSLIVAIDAAILNDCTRKWMFSTLGPSKRLRFRLPAGGTWVDVRLFLSLLDLYELDLLPLRRHLSPRHLSIWLRRWPEFIELLRLVVRHKVLGRPFKIASLYPVESRP